MRRYCHPAHAEPSGVPRDHEEQPGRGPRVAPDRPAGGTDALLAAPGQPDPPRGAPALQGLRPRPALDADHTGDHDRRLHRGVSVRLPYPRSPTTRCSSSSALTVWTLFFGSATVAVSSLVGQPGLVTKVRFPRALITIATMGGNALTGLAMLIVAIVTSVVVTGGVHPGRSCLLPLLVVLLAMLSVGFGLIVAAVQVYFRDVEHIMAAIGLPWIFLSPVFYTFDDAPRACRTTPLLENVLHWAQPTGADHPRLPGRALLGDLAERAATCSTRSSSDAIVLAIGIARVPQAGARDGGRALMVAAAPGEIRLDGRRAQVPPRPPAQPDPQGDGAPPKARRRERGVGPPRRRPARRARRGRGRDRAATGRARARC